MRDQRDWLGRWSAEPGSPGPTPRYCVSAQIAADFHDIMRAVGENSLVPGREREICAEYLCGRHTAHVPALASNTSNYVSRKALPDLASQRRRILAAGRDALLAAPDETGKPDIGSRARQGDHLW